MPTPDLVCKIDDTQGMVDALSAVRWKRHQVLLLFLLPVGGLVSSSSLSLIYQVAWGNFSEHGIVLMIEESGCLQAKVYLQRELSSLPCLALRRCEKLFVLYEYNAGARPQFGLSLGLFVDCLNTFSVPGSSSSIKIRYPAPDMQLLLRSVDSLDACIYAEIRTRIPDTIPWDFNFAPAGSNPISFTVKSAALKEAIDDLGRLGSSIKITLQPTPPTVTFKGEGHGDMEVDFMYYGSSDLLVAFHCDQEVSNRYKYKFLHATTANLSSNVIKDDRGSKITIGRGGVMKVQHLVSVARSSKTTHHASSAGYQQPSRIAYIEFFLKPEENIDD